MIISLKKYRSHSFVRALVAVIKKTVFSTLSKNKWKTSLKNKDVVLFNYRKYPELIKNESGLFKCTSCLLCEKVCPTKALKITAPNAINISASLKEGDPPKKFEMDLEKCILCGLCEDVCPTNAIGLSKKYDIHQFACTTVDLLKK